MADSVHALEPIDIKPEPLAEIVFGVVRDAIVKKDLPPGSRISEARLAAQLKVSKTPVREAILRLEGIGLIITDGNRGSRVVTPSAENIQHAFEVRMALEAFAAQRAAEPDAPTDHKLLRDLAEQSLRCAEAGDGAGFRELDRQFHASVATATDNELLIRLANNAYTLVWALRQRDTPSIGYQVGCAQQHLRIVDAIDAHNTTGAAAEMTTHIDKSRRFVLEFFENGPVVAG